MSKPCPGATCNGCGPKCLRWHDDGCNLVERAEPLEEHGAGPAPPRKIRRNVYLK